MGGQREGEGEKTNMALPLPLFEPSEGRWSKAQAYLGLNHGSAAF